jgi:dihydroorotate dehydrogenase electron transfer subunit
VTAPPRRRAARVTGRESHGAYVVLRCSDPDGPRPQAGQFYMLTAGTRWGGGAAERPFLPRAFSVLRTRPAVGDRDRFSPSGGEAGSTVAAATGQPPAGHLELQFLIEDVGPGTNRLCELGPGDELLLLGPLGAGFAAPREERSALLVGGGVGIAPLAIWQDQMESAGADSIGGDRRVIARRHSRCENAEAITLGAIPPGEVTIPPGEVTIPRSRVTVLLGFRDAAHAPGALLLRGARIATDDGSVGHQGLVTELLEEELERDPDREVYACGPPPMLEATARVCAERGIPAQLALEAGMACGFGACYGCVVPTRRGYLRLCIDGPVLDAALLAAPAEDRSRLGGVRH